MAGTLNFIATGEDSGNLTFSNLLPVLAEFRRALTELKQKNAVHSGQLPLAEAEKKAIEVETLIIARDPRAFEKSTQIIQSCTQCHL